MSVRDEMVARLWRGRDPFLGFPADLYAADSQGWRSEHLYLTDSFATLRPRVVVEVGVWKGASSLHMARALKDQGLDAAVISVDTWLGSAEHWVTDWFDSLGTIHGQSMMIRKFMNNVVAAGLQDVIVPLPLDSSNAMQVLKHIGVRPEVVHIDGAHDYEAVTADLRAWWPLLAPGGLLIGDDYIPGGGWPDVKRAFDDFFEAQGCPPLEHHRGKCRVFKPPA